MAFKSSSTDLSPLYKYFCSPLADFLASPYVVTALCSGVHQYYSAFPVIDSFLTLALSDSRCTWSCSGACRMYLETLRYVWNGIMRMRCGALFLCFCDKACSVVHCLGLMTNLNTPRYIQNGIMKDPGASGMEFCLCQVRAGRSNAHHYMRPSLHIHG